MNIWREFREGDNTATFVPDDFETWWMAGMERSDKVKRIHEFELYQNCTYIARTEQRVMTQRPHELRHAIRQWAEGWNVRIDMEATK